MDENTTRLVEQLRSNPAMLQGLMRSQDGQALMQMLTQGDRGTSLQRAAQAAALGNPHRNGKNDEPGHEEPRRRSAGRADNQKAIQK